MLPVGFPSAFRIHNNNNLNIFHGSRETRLEAEFSASAVGTPPPSRIQEGNMDDLPPFRRCICALILEGYITIMHNNING